MSTGAYDYFGLDEKKSGQSKTKQKKPKLQLDDEEGEISSSEEYRLPNRDKSASIKKMLQSAKVSK